MQLTMDVCLSVQCCRYCQDVNMPMDKTAQVLAHYARHRASDPKFASPFAYAAFQVCCCTSS